MIEIVTLKLGIDLFDYLSVYNLQMKNVQLYLWLKQINKYKYYTFNSYDDLWNFYIEKYQPFNICSFFGDIWCVSKFTLTSKLDENYTMSMSAFDVGSDDYYIKDVSQYDKNRNNVWNVSKERQITTLDTIVKEYNKYYKELYDIYISGLYSLCYSNLGWTTHTTKLKSYRDMFLNSIEDKQKINFE